jgi:hypothetical protein
MLKLKLRLMKSERQVDGVVFLQSASGWWPREVGYKMIGMLVETGVVSDA